MTPYELGFMMKCADAGLDRHQSLCLYKQAISAGMSVIGAGGLGALAGGGIGALVPVKKDKHSKRRRFINALTGAVIGGGALGGLAYGSKKRMFDEGYKGHKLKRDWWTDHRKMYNGSSKGRNGVIQNGTPDFWYTGDKGFSHKIIGESADLPGFYFFEGEPDHLMNERLSLRGELEDRILHNKFSRRDLRPSRDLSIADFKRHVFDVIPDKEEYMRYKGYSSNPAKAYDKYLRDRWDTRYEDAWTEFVRNLNDRIERSLDVEQEMKDSNGVRFLGR